MKEQWQVCTIEQLGEIDRGRSKHRPRNDSILFGGKYPFIQTGDVKRSNLYITDYSETYNEIGLAQSRLWKKGTLCITIAANIAESSLLGIDACFPDSVVGFQPFSGIADTVFVKYLIDTLKVYMLQISKGTTQDNLSLEKLRRVKFKIPSYETQIRIASILSAYDNLIEINNKRIKVLEQMAENLYKEWFVRFRFPGHENTEFENGIPKGWEYCTVETLSSVLQRGISPDYDEEGELTVISQKCIRQNIMDIREARRQTKAFKPELNIIDGDTVICSTGTGTLGRVGQVYGNFPNATFDSHVTLVRAKPLIGKHFLYWTLKEMQQWFMNMGIGSTNQQELYCRTIKNAKVLNPNNELISLFEGVVEPIHSSIIFLIRTQDTLIRQRDMLLPRLMSGKMDVNGTVETA